ncbi:MAG: TM2 domain-containing protein [Bacteroidia bacterium]|nr:TM2 domain-containing protein [Bacteroidia bacterium]
MLNLTSAEHLSLKEKLALKIVRGKLKKDVRRIKKGKKTTAGDNQLVALLLCFFVGYLGIHRFYLGYIGLGVLELLTGGLCGILTLIDFIRIILGTLKPKGGEYSKTL